MSDGDKPSGPGVGKIVLIVVLVLLGIGILCCGVGGFLVRDKIKAGVQFGTATVAMQERVQKDLGKGVLITFAPDEDGMVLLVGLPGGPKDADVADAQDKAWRAYCEAFKEGGLPIGSVAIGRAATPGSSTPVRGWRKNMVSVEEVTARTGAHAPPTSELFKSLDKDNIQIQSGGGGDDGGDDENDVPEDAPK